MPKPVITFVFKLLRKWAASVHTLHMTKPVMTLFVRKVLRSGLPRWILYTCLWCFTHAQKPVLTFVFKVQQKGLPRDIFRHAEACDKVRVQSGTDPVDCPGLYLLYTLHMPKPVYNSRVQNATDGHASLRTATHKICPSPGPHIQAVPEHKRVATAESTRKRATPLPHNAANV